MAVNKVVYGTTVLVDLTGDTVTADKLMQGYTAHDRSGALITGIATGGSGDTYTLTTVVPQQTFTVSDSDHQAILTSTGGFEDGELYLITFDGEEYASPCELLWGADYCVGDINPFMGNYTVDNVFPVGLIWEYDIMNVATRDTSQHTIKVEHLEFVDGPLNLITKTVTANGTYTASSDNADGYSSVTVNVPSSGSSMNVQVAQSTTRVASTTYTETASLTCSTTGTYDVYWDCFRSTTSGTSGSQLHVGGSTYGSANTTFSNHVQNNHLTGVQISAGQEVAVYVRSRATNYYAYCGQLTIVQTA